jgi:3-oxoadipate enol-lactonase
VPFLERGDARIHYQVSGSGPPTLGLSGFASTAEAWDLFEPFLPGCTLVRFDYRLTGASTAPDLSVTPAQSAADAAALLEELGTGPAAVFGISAGGMVGLELALDRPDLVSRLVLGCTTPGGEGWFDRLRLSEDLWDLLVGVTLLPHDPSAAYDLLLPILVPERQVTPEMKKLFMDQLTARHHPPTPAWALLRHLQGQMLPGYDVRDRLGELRMPVLVQHGTADRLIPFGEGELIAKSVPQAELHALPGAAHVYWLEDPAGVFARVAQFVQGG